MMDHGYHIAAFCSMQDRVNGVEGRTGNRSFLASATHRSFQCESPGVTSDHLSRWSDLTHRTYSLQAARLGHRDLVVQLSLSLRMGPRIAWLDRPKLLSRRSPDHEPRPPPPVRPKLQGVIWPWQTL
jgi:hypothetical protein